MDESEVEPHFLNVSIKEEWEEIDNSVEESKEEQYINECFKKESIEISDIKEEHQDSFEECSHNESSQSITENPLLQTNFTVESEELNEVFKDESTIVYDNIKTEFEGGIFNDSQHMLQIPLEHHDYMIRKSEDTPLNTSQEKKCDSSNKGEKKLPVSKKKNKTKNKNNQNRWHLKNNFPPRLSYKCFKCKKEFRNRNDISEHLKVIHCTENYECNECGKWFLRKGHLYGHILYCHLGASKHNRSKCGNCSYNKRYCDSNISACRNTKGFQGAYTCDQCDRQFVSKKSLEMHLLLICGKKICLCVEDEIRSVKISSMLKHKVQQFNCEVCHKCFDNMYSFHNHLPIHKNIKHFICMQCGKCFAMEKHLISHLKIHKGIKDCICLKCGKCFYAKTDLNRHQISHSGIKKFVCAICGQRFSQRVNLCRHLKLHDGSESYKCDVCDKYFRAKSNRDRHVLTHKDIYFHCGICNKSLKDKGWFQKHVNSHKNIK